MANAGSSSAKKDLHAGGLSVDPGAALASVIDPLLEASEDWIRKARELADTADDYVRANPWQAMGVAALLSVTLGYLLGRRS